MALQCWVSPERWLTSRTHRLHRDLSCKKCDASFPSQCHQPERQTFLALRAAATRSAESFSCNLRFLRTDSGTVVTGFFCGALKIHQQISILFIVMGMQSNKWCMHIFHPSRAHMWQDMGQVQHRAWRWDANALHSKDDGNDCKLHLRRQHRRADGPNLLPCHDGHGYRGSIHVVACKTRPETQHNHKQRESARVHLPGHFDFLWRENFPFGYSQPMNIQRIQAIFRIILFFFVSRNHAPTPSDSFPWVYWNPHFCQTDEHPHAPGHPVLDWRYTASFPFAVPAK